MAEDWITPQTQEQEGWESGRRIPIKVRGYEEEIPVVVENQQDLVNKIKEVATNLGIGSFTVLINRREVTPNDVMNMNLDEIENIEILPYDKGA